MALLQNVLMLQTIGDVAVVLESSASAASMPVSQLFEQPPTERWRSTDLNSAYFEIDLGSALSIDFVALLYTNASSTATWRIRIASSKANLTASPIYDSRTYWASDIDHWNSNPAMVAASMNLAGWPRTHAFHDIASDTTASQNQFVRIDVYDASNTDGFYEMGRFYLGLKFQPTINLQYGSAVPFFIEQPVRVVTEGGLKNPVPRPRARELGGRILFQDIDEVMDNMFELSRVKGSSGDLMMIFNPASKWAHHFSMYGLFRNLRGTTAVYSMYDVPFSFEELL